MKCSLITTIFNESSSIADFIRCINDQTRLPDEIIIVDGGSTDDTVKIVEKNINKSVLLKLIIDPSCNRSQCIAPIAKGRNVAIEAASHDIILITDAGCFLDKNWVFEMTKPFAEGFDVVAGNYKALPGNYFQNYLADVFCPELHVEDPKKFLPSSRSLGIKKMLWDKVGGYPLNSYTAEDTKFDILIYEITDKVYFAKNAIVYWELPIGFKELWKKVFNYGVGDGIQRLDTYRYIFRAIMILFPLPFFILVLLGKRKLIGYFIYVAQVSGYLSSNLRRKK